MDVPAMVGIDSSDDHHDVFAAVQGAPEEWTTQIGNDLQSFSDLLDSLRTRWPDRRLRFGIENPRSLLGRFLLFIGCTVYAVNPRSVARAREGLAASGRKDDKLDARTISLVLRERGDDLTPEMPDTPEGVLLAGLIEQRTGLIREKTRAMNQLTATLKSYYPRALEVFAHLDQPITLSFLEAFPGPSSLVAEASRQFRALFDGSRYPRPARIDVLWKSALAPQVPVAPVEETLGVRQVRHLTRVLALILADIEQVEGEIEAAFGSHPDAGFFGSLPGAAKVLAPSLLALFGDNRARWRGVQHLATYTGAVPVTRQSGRKRTVQMRRHCSHEGRRVLHLFANCSRRQADWAERFYQAQREAGKTHAAALRNLAAKWLRIIYRMWLDHEPYNPTRYSEALVAHDSPHRPPGTSHGALTCA